MVSTTERKNVVIAKIDETMKEQQDIYDKQMQEPINDIERSIQHLVDAFESAKDALISAIKDIMDDEYNKEHYSMSTGGYYSTKLVIKPKSLFTSYDNYRDTPWIDKSNCVSMLSKLRKDTNKRVREMAIAGLAVILDDDSDALQAFLDL